MPAGRDKKRTLQDALATARKATSATAEKSARAEKSVRMNADMAGFATTSLFDPTGRPRPGTRILKPEDLEGFLNHKTDPN